MDKFSDFLSLPPSHIQNLIPYQPGKSIASLQQELGIQDVIKLASNENPLGCSPKVHEALCGLSPATIASYPAPDFHPLVPALATHLGIEPNQLLLAHGSDACFTLLMTTFVLHTSKHILTHQLAFNAFTIQAQALGVPAQVVPIEADWRVNVSELIQATTYQTALIFLASPNNPTGLAIPFDEIKRVLTHIPSSTLLVLDEAYFDYADQSENTVTWLKTYPNLVLLRTFSKAYGLAGLRIGYAMAHPDIIQLLRRVQLPFTISETAMTGALAALKDQDFIQQTRNMTETGKKQLQEGLQAFPFTSLPSQANFITLNCHQDALPIYETLLQQGIIVRPLTPYGLRQHLRITIGTPEQNKRLLNALKSCL